MEPATPQAMEERAQWGSKLGFILSAMGSAVGFGSIARFPMNVANNGGAVFVVLYAGIMILIGVPLMISEFSMGRTSQKNTVGTFKHLSGNPRTPWRTAGWLYFLMAAFFLSWYAVVSGWVLRYAFVSLGGAYFDDTSGYQFNTTEGPDALFWHFGVMALTLVAVTGKISKGIEKVNLFMMPTLFAIILGLAIYAMTLDNVVEGYKFYLRPDFGAVTLGVVTAAFGQAFFSLSLGQGAMMTYASYLPKSNSLANSSLTIALSTLTFALTCGFMIFPMLAAFGLLSGDVAGLDLIFGPLSNAFAQMGSPTGNIVGFFFFTATFFAAFTSAVSLTEPMIAYVSEEWRIPRIGAAFFTVIAIYTAGVPAAFSEEFLGLAGGALTDFLVILGGFLIALYVGWFSPTAKARERMDMSEGGLRLSWYVLPVARYVLPVVLVILMFFAVAGTPCALSGGAEAGGIVGEFGGDLIGCDG